MTYGIPYTVRGWGDEIVTTVAIRREDQLRDFTAVVRGTEPGPVILVPTSALTPVDTTPPEPEPGAWLIGDRVVERIQCDPDEFSPFEPECWRTFANSLEWSWTEFWKEYGGPGVTIRRLVPEPAPVELPWTMDGGHATIEIGPTLKLAGGCDSLYMGSDEAIGLGHALITAGERAAAARAAREATP